MIGLPTLGDITFFCDPSRCVFINLEQEQDGVEVTISDSSLLIITQFTTAVTFQEARLWADEVARLVNEATSPKPSVIEYREVVPDSDGIIWRLGVPYLATTVEIIRSIAGAKTKGTGFWFKDLPVQDAVNQHAAKERLSPACLDVTKLPSGEIKFHIRFADGRGGEFIIVSQEVAAQKCRILRSLTVNAREWGNQLLSPPSFADWQPTPEQIDDVVSDPCLTTDWDGVTTSKVRSNAYRFLYSWQRVFKESQTEKATNHAATAEV